MKSISSGQRVVKKRLADGTIKTYTYTRERKPARSRHHPESYSALLRAYRRSPEWSEKVAVTLARYQHYLEIAEDAWGHIPARDLRRREILKMRDTVIVKNGPGAAVSFLRVVSASLTWGVDRGWLEHNPAMRIKPPKTGHWPAWTLAEAEHAMAVLTEPYRRLILLGMYTGQRRQDLVTLAWSAYDGLTIQVRQSKTGARLTIPVHPVLKAELDEWRRTATSTTILTNHRGRPWKPNTLSTRFRRALQANGIVRDLNVHGLRKLAATSLAEAGCSTHEIAAITGHRSLSMIALYTRSVDQERLASAAIVRLQTGRDNRRKPSKEAV